ncbi:hypothetical protein [Cupriavidus sp. CuC1]|uniref:hypothetical protein n=1 Tax=Cupriavidus sp. CuC1 TaxID=3373131 RepID=UPI0037CCE88B
MGNLARNIRLLKLQLEAGTSVPFFPWGDTLVLYIDEAPYELRVPLRRWLDLQPDLMNDPEVLWGPRGVAITEARWIKFMDWVNTVVTRELDAAEHCGG